MIITFQLAPVVIDYLYIHVQTDVLLTRVVKGEVPFLE